MASYSLYFKPSVQKDLRSPPKVTVVRVMKHNESLKTYDINKIKIRKSQLCLKKS